MHASVTQAAGSPGGGRSASPYTAGCAGEHECSHPGGGGFFQQRQGSLYIRFEKRLHAVSNNMRLVQGGSVIDGVHTLHTVSDALGIRDRPDHRSKRRRVRVQADNFVIVVLQCTDQRLSQMPGAAGNEYLRGHGLREYGRKTYDTEYPTITGKWSNGMIVRTLDDLKTAGNYRENPGVWSSARYLLRRDGLAFTVTQTTVAAGSQQTLEYRNHIEANLVIEGEGDLTDVATGEVHSLKPGTMYALDKHDRHQIKALTDMRLVCIFSPALLGPETHDADGSYPVLEG